MSDLTTAGAVRAAEGILSLYTAALTRVAVGDSLAAFSSAQTTLQGVNTARSLVIAATRVSNRLTYTATFATSAANFTWNEVGIFDDASAGTMLVRKVQAIGLKDSSQAWTLEINIDFTAG